MRPRPRRHSRRRAVSRQPHRRGWKAPHTIAASPPLRRYGQALVDAAAEAGIPTCISYVAIKGGQAAGPSTALHPAAARPAAGSSGGGFGPVIMINGTGAGTGTGSDSSQAHIRTSIQGEGCARVRGENGGMLHCAGVQRG